MKKIFMLLILALFSTSIVNASRPNYIFDEYDLLTYSQESTINDMCLTVDKETSVEIVVVIESYLDPYVNIEDMALAYFNEIPLDNVTGIGKADKNNGVLLIMTMKTGDSRIEVGIGLETILTKSVCESILSNILTPNLNDYKDFDAIKLSVEAIAKKVTPEAAAPIVVPPEQSIVNTESFFNRVFGLLPIIMLLMAIPTLFNLANRKEAKSNYTGKAKTNSRRVKTYARKTTTPQSLVSSVQPIHEKPEEETPSTIVQEFCPSCNTMTENEELVTRHEEHSDDTWFWLYMFHTLNCKRCNNIYEVKYEEKKVETLVARKDRQEVEAKYMQETEKRKQDTENQRREAEKQRQEDYRKRQEKRRSEGESDSFSSRSSFSGGYGGGMSRGGGGAGSFRPR